jgi:ATP-binding cassette subfamily B protein
MLKDAPVVIMDEATAYTDPENEALVQESVAQLVIGRTLIVIAHRLSTIQTADRIFVINDGLVEAEGKHEELLDYCALYRKMWEAHSMVRDEAATGDGSCENSVPEEKTNATAGDPVTGMEAGKEAAYA